MIGETLRNPQRRIDRLRAGDAIGVIDEQLFAPAPLRRADEQVAQGLDEGRAQHKGRSCVGGVSQITVPCTAQSSRRAPDVVKIAHVCMMVQR